MIKSHLNTFLNALTNKHEKTGALLKIIAGWGGLANFLENITTCFIKSRLNSIFHLWIHSLFVGSYLLHFLAEVLLSCKIGNSSKESSAKSLTVDNTSFVRLLMKIKKESGQRMELCGATVLAGNHSDVWPFIRTLWNLLLKKLSMRFKSNSETQHQLIWAYI